jgi:N-acetylglucosamine kinase-like BadF-type ATPase
MRYFLGVDTGGTKTNALIAAENGEVVGFGESGPGNHESVGYEGVAQTLSRCVSQALTQSGLEKHQICGAGFGIAGYDFPSEREATLATIATLGLECPLDATNDVALGVIAGARDGWGLAIDSGTGNNVRGRDPKGREGWVTGCGGTFGEYGGAGEIVARAVQMVSHHWSKRGQPTSLSDAFISAVGAKNLGDLIEGIAQGWYHLKGSHVRLVFQAAGVGDTVAQGVIRWAGQELGETANAVIRQLNIQTESFDIVLIGSVFKGGSMFLEPLQQTIWSLAPGASFTRLEVPPVAGGVLWGMEQVGLHSPALRQALFDSIHAAIQKTG